MKLYDILKEELESDQEEQSQFPLTMKNYFYSLLINKKNLILISIIILLFFRQIKKLFVTMPNIRKKHIKYVHEINSDGSIDDGKEISEYMSDVSMNFSGKILSKNTVMISGGMPQHYSMDQAIDIESVLANGLEARDESRGLNNRHVGSAVFLTSEQDKAEAYGDVVAIDTAAMKKDGLTPFVTQEPDIFEEEMLGAIAHRLDYDDYHYEYGDIPAKYLSEV